MNGLKLGPEAEAIYGLANQYGCVSIDQVNDLFSGEQSKQVEQRIKTALSNLCNRKAISFMNGFITTITKPRPDSEMIDGMWVAMDILKDADSGKITENGREALLMGQCPKATKSSYILISFLKGTKNIYNIISLTSNTLAQADFAQTAHFGKEPGLINDKDIENDISRYVFVTRDEKVPDLLREHDIKLNYIVALISGNVGKKPQIKYIKKGSK